MSRWWSVQLVFVIIITVKSESDSSENTPPYAFSYLNPSSLNFQEIYTSIVTSAEDKTTVEEDTSTTEETNYLMKKNRLEYVEFHPQLTTEGTTVPPPKYLVNSTFLRHHTKPKKTTTTEEPDDIIEIIPVKTVQRGVLDLLFPKARVKTFKNIFDSFKRMLSHTLRR